MDLYTSRIVTNDERLAGREGNSSSGSKTQGSFQPYLSALMRGKFFRLPELLGFSKEIAL